MSCPCFGGQRRRPSFSSVKPHRHASKTSRGSGHERFASATFSSHNAGLPFPHSNHTDRRQGRAEEADLVIRSTNVRVRSFLAFIFVPLTCSCSSCRIRVSMGNVARLPFPHSNHTDNRQRRADGAASVVRSTNVCVRSFLAFVFLPLTRSCSLCRVPVSVGNVPRRRGGASPALLLVIPSTAPFVCSDAWPSASLLLNPPAGD